MRILFIMFMVLGGVFAGLNIINWEISTFAGAIIMAIAIAGNEIVDEINKK